ncbi:MAG: hypothetical protein EXS02_10570 [Planctomycetes bacterium]|nr:hypothetical protein [Planctomycetota bacterium]
MRRPVNGAPPSPAPSSRIFIEVKGCSRVCLDILSKPPATIEWE